MIKEFFKGIWAGMNSPYVLIAGFIFAGGMLSGFYTAKTKYQKEIADINFSYAQAEVSRITAYNVSLQTALTKQRIQQERADSIGFELLNARNDLKLVTNKLQKEVIYVAEKDKNAGDTCPAFSPDGLRLYTEALGYSRPND